MICMMKKRYIMMIIIIHRRFSLKDHDDHVGDYATIRAVSIRY